MLCQGRSVVYQIVSLLNCFVGEILESSRPNSNKISLTPDGNFLPYSRVDKYRKTNK